jgi:hypothetical protein
MSYNAPELRKVGRAAAIVLGGLDGHGDGPEPTDENNRPALMELGLDD